MTTATYGLALLAGTLSTLSPCVLPLLPAVLGAAAAEHRFGPVALGAGLGLSFAGIGLFLATAGFTLGLDPSLFSAASAVMLAAIGAVLIFPVLQNRVAAVFVSPVANWAGRRMGGQTAGLGGQFGIGLLLGALWSPCTGPTLGAASVLAAQGKDLAQVTLAMLLFALGAALPLLAAGMLSRQVFMRLRGGLMTAGGAAKTALGVFLFGAGLLVLTGLDKSLETALVDASPAWLTQLTTRF
jgi:cytochrome c biogenesis protein CcdA